MNSYEAKQEAKRQRFEDLAAKNKAASSAAYEKSKRISGMIPLGQPILVGHHSEKRHRSDLKKIDNAIHKSVEADDKAEYYARKAASVGTGGISSDDPEAVQKLNKKIEGAERCQSMMKQANRIIRQAPKYQNTPEKIKALIELGYSQSQAVEIFTPDCFGGIGFAHYSLSNNNANIRRMKERLESLKNRPTESTEKQVGEITIVENVEENRIQLIFPDKPSDEIRNVLKSNGFRWSRYNKAWQRHLNNNGRYAAKRVLKDIS